MVMAQYPNTQYVAHEFVRQYYTMLHKDPSQLHRFYTKESRLTHGGAPNSKIEDPVVGQEAIHEKISQLNFNNCYAKIRSVDSHPTIGHGVVIQVTGELSNSGMAMRKFMQTFVLAQQDLKKYNVYNDIFRYQDEYFDDTENEETVDGTIESETGYLNHEPNTNETSNLTHENEDYKERTTQVTSESSFVHQNNNHVTNINEVENVAFEETSGEDDYDDYENKEELVDTHENPEFNEEKEVSTETSLETDEVDVPENSYYQDSPEQEVVDDVEPSAPEVDEPHKPFTWASLAKKNPQASPPVVSKHSSKKVVPPQPQQPQIVPPSKKEEVAPSKKEVNEEPTRKRLQGGTPDSHQVFIGNLPPNVTDREIRDVFKEFGNIVEIRLNSKNFGFIAFDGPDAPNKILLKTKPIIINSNTINIEEKRSGAGNRGSYRGGRGDRGGGDRGGFRGPSSSRGGRSSYGQRKNTDDIKSDKLKEPRAAQEPRATREQRQPRIKN